MDRCFGILEFLEPEDEIDTVVTACACKLYYLLCLSLGTSTLRAPEQRGSAASRRHLSRRDMRELVSITANLSLAEARAFERFRVTVHLDANPVDPAAGRPAGIPDLSGTAGGGTHGQPARHEQPRTARQQHRFERGQQRREQRKQSRNSNPY
mmetsp:Transcript_16536/g.33243  ORF Transcript_16536/g.33243 Transcript_16536/m.33243 type:complete len:153 (-) Transcript_16536:340-798(-)